MEEGKIILRPARPDIEEGRLFARYLDQAADGFFRVMLGKNVESIVAKAYLEPGHSLSYENAVFAERDGKVARMSSAFSGAQQRKFSDEPLQRAAGRAALRLAVVHFIFAPMWRILETVEENDFYLQSVAVDPEHRGTGIGSLLMDDVEEKASSGGWKRLTLDVSAKNDGAQRLYSRRGMVRISDWPSAGFLPTILVRMGKELKLEEVQQPDEQEQVLR